MTWRWSGRWRCSLHGGGGVAGFDREVLEAATREREVELTTYGRRTERPSRRILWVWGDGERLYVRAGGGLGRDWPRNLLAHGRGILHLSGRDVPVRARLVTDAAEARAGAALISRKYGVVREPSSEGAPLLPAEQATFELTPQDSPSP
jgi:hypothetical protein